MPWRRAAARIWSRKSCSPADEMQLQALGAVDAVVGTPFSPARSEHDTNRRCSTVKNTARSAAKANCRSPARTVNTARQRTSCHSRSNSSAGRRDFALLHRQHHRALRQPGDRARRRSRSTCARTISLRPRLAMMRCWCGHPHACSRPDKRRSSGRCACRAHMPLASAYAALSQLSSDIQRNYLAPHFGAGILEAKLFCRFQPGNPPQLPKSGLDFLKLRTTAVGPGLPFELENPLAGSAADQREKTQPSRTSVCRPRGVELG